MSYVSISKHNNRIYGKLPAKQADNQPCDTLCIDLVGKYRMTRYKGGRKYAMKGKKDKDVYLQAITAIASQTTSIYRLKIYFSFKKIYGQMHTSL